MIELLQFALSWLLGWNHDPDIDSVRGGIALLFLIVFIVLVVVCSGALLALR
jgi:hypothetical protein